LKLKAIKIRTRYWTPGTDYVREIVDAVKHHAQDGDFITISEKALSTAQGMIVDESLTEPGRLARFLVSFWIRRIWGGPLGSLTKLRGRTLEHLRNFPLVEGAAHKQIALNLTSLLQALRHYSEGGIDASNLPYSYVSLPLPDSEDCAQRINMALRDQGIRTTTLIVDGDTTYTWRNLHLAPRSVQTPGLIHLGGFLTFLVGRWLRFDSRSTPVAVSGDELNPDWALTLANVSHRVRGFGAGRTVWDMARRLGVGLTGVTWGMLEEVEHYPIVILRRCD
jgi:F420-0:gamma-glutamyl ligase-like protein